MQFEDFLFDGFTGDEPISKDGSRLSDAMGAVYCLGLLLQVPPGIEDVDVLGGG